MLCISLRLTGLNIYFCDVQKGVYRNDGLFLLWDCIKVSWINPLYTTDIVEILGLQNRMTQNNGTLLVTNLNIFIIFFSSC